VSFASEIRASLPAALAKINAALLLGDAEHGRAERVALHASLISLIHRDATGVRRTLEASAAPVARRIDNYVAAAGREVSDESVPALAAALMLVRNCDDDLRLVETLCGREDAYTELSTTVADAALACLVAHQRRTKDDQSCLPLLVYLLNLAVTPELRQRLEDTYQVIRDNIVSASDSGTEHEVEHRLIRELIFPHIDTLQLSPAGRLQFTSRIAEWLANLGRTAWHELEQRELARAVYTSALELPCQPAVRARLEEQCAQVDAEIRQREKSVRLERAGHRIVIDAEGISFDEHRLAHDEVTGVRHGLSPESGRVIAWCSADRVVVLDSSNVFAGDGAETAYAALLEALHHFIVPELGARLVEAIRGDATVFVGPLALNRVGAALAANPLSPEEAFVPYARLRYHLNDDSLVVTDVENPALAQSHSLAEIWNATIIGSVIDALAHDANPVLT
jgi:hypothetical protein